MNCLKYNQCCSTDWLQRKHTHGLAIRCCVTVKTSSLPCSNSKFYCLTLQVIRQLNSICAMKAGFQREETILDNCDKYITKHNSNLLGNRFECVPLGFWQVNTVIYWVNPNGVYQNTQKSKGEVIMKIKLHSKTFLSATILWINSHVLLRDIWHCLLPSLSLAENLPKANAHLWTMYGQSSSV